MQFPWPSFCKYISSVVQMFLLCVVPVGVFAQQAPDAKPAASSTAPAGAQTSSPDPKQGPSTPTNPQASSSQTSDSAKPSLPPGVDSKTGMPLYETIQEDWSSLTIGTSKLQAEEPVVTPTEVSDTFTRTLIQVKWRPGDPLDLYIILPKGVKKPPAVLYLYGYDQDTDRFKNDRWAARVTSGGVAAIGFVSALSGHRFHDRPMKQWFVSELQESVGSTVHDVKFILDYLAQRGEVDMDRIGMFGQGSGGTIAILAAAADPRIKAVDTLDPWGDWPDFLKKSPLVLDNPDSAEYAKPDFLKKVAPLDPVKWLPTLKVPVRIQQVRQDIAIPTECKQSITDAAPKQAEVMRFEASTDLASREGMGRLFDWMKSRLQQSGKSDPGKTSMADSKAALSVSEHSSHP